MTEKPKISRVEVYWHTVKYRTVALYFIVITTIMLTTTYLVFPEVSASVMKHLSDAVGPREGGVATIYGAPSPLRESRRRKFKVKKLNSVTWTTAVYQITLDKGDLIQTGPDGVARIAFADGTTYTVKGDTLVTVEENSWRTIKSTQRRRAHQFRRGGLGDTRVGIASDRKAEVSFANARRQCGKTAARRCAATPTTNEGEITVVTGGAERDNAATSS